MEKSLPIASEHYTPKPAARQGALRVVLFGLLALALCVTWYSPSLTGLSGRAGCARKHGKDKQQQQCRQIPALFPATHDDKVQKAYDFLSSPAFENASIARLSGAIQVQTESFDDLGAVGEDNRWDVFYNFHKYLQDAFPHIHKHLKVEKVNTHGLVYTWQGSKEELKPVVLMAHQDVVPVDRDTVDSWTYPPWSGHYDGKNIWGRGSSDCKNSLIGTMETVETLIEAGFEPKRTIVLSFGFDEECSGTQGAGHLAPFLLERYGENGVALIVDEGMGYEKAFGRGFAVPGVAEKGYTDVNIAVRIPGGHSSIPPDHTSIGILSEIITQIEADHYPTYLADDNPYLEFLGCGAEYAPDFPKKLKKLLKQRKSAVTSSKKNDHLAQEAAKMGLGTRYLMQTSQAVDIVKGGTKTNALPEQAVALVNHRINIGDEPETVWRHIASIVKPIAKKYNLTLHAFDGETAAYKSISLSAKNTTLNVAPVTPTDTDKLTAYSVISGTIRALYGEDTVVAPALMTGNTDTRYYWDLTKNIFRFGPGYVNEEDSGIGNIHTVDERITVSNHLKVVKWFTLFLRNMDDAELEVD